MISVTYPVLEQIVSIAATISEINNNNNGKIVVQHTQLK